MLLVSKVLCHVCGEGNTGICLGKPEGNDYLEDIGVDVRMRTDAILGYYAASGGNLYIYKKQTNEMYNFLIF